MDGLLGPRATWLAALGAGLSAAERILFVLNGLSGVSTSPGRVFLAAASILAEVAWCWYFASLYRAERGLPAPVSFRRTTIVTLVLVFGARVFFLGLNAVTSTFFDTIGILTLGIEAMSIILWVVVLLALGFHRLREQLALAAVLLIGVTLVQSMNTINAILSLPQRLAGSLGSPLYALQLIGLIYWLSQILFLISLKSDPAAMTPELPRAPDRSL
ncbi:MAG: hypothetical protein ABI824_06380 [Acidobacteriota bacterium]